MKIMIITSSPNMDGLTAACGNAARQGIEEMGIEVVLFNLNKLDIGSCKACGSGWGPCLNAHECQVEDDFQMLHGAMWDSQGFVFVTPVYWGDMSESAKAFLDRLRRCEAWKQGATFLQDKPFISVAAAGGSGNGLITTLLNMERLLIHVKAERFDYIGITKKNRPYKLVAIREASKAMVEYIKSK